MKALRFGLIINVLILATLFGCGDANSRRQNGARTFEHERPVASPTQKNPDPAEPAVPLTPEEKNDAEALKAAPLILKGEVTSAMPAYQVPEKLRERLRQSNPDLVAPYSKKFDVINQHLHIKAKDSTMTFSAVLRIPGKQEEPIELRCTFDQSTAPWSCDQMYPTDPKVAAERRLQATVNCLDTHRCDRVGVELYVVIDGKTESQHFQNEKFSARRATSGDALESEEGVTPLKNPVPVGPLKPVTPRVLEKPTRPAERSTDPTEPLESPRDPNPSVPAATEPPKVENPESPEKPISPPPLPRAKPPVPVVSPEPVPVPAPSLNEAELEEVMDDPNSALEISAPVPMPVPGRGQFSIPGIETLRPETGSGVKVQAIGFHNGGSLRSGTQLNASGAGFVCRQRANRNYGTELTISLLKGAAEAVERRYPNKSPFVIANISQQGGGRLCNGGSCHASHQTGLDVDIAFPSQKSNSDLWSLCGSNGCRAGGHISDDFDEERFFLFVKTLVGAQSRPIIAMFIDTQIKKHMCQWARNKGEDISNPDAPAFRALQAMKHEPGHHNHVHVRFKCPGNRDCRDATVSLGRGTGC